MGGDIIAERFSLLKTRGSNGVAFTYIVEDTLDGRRLVLKVSDQLGMLSLEYHKACNLLAECGVKGILLPTEGGLLDEDGGYYLAYPELGEPSLESYIRMRHILTCGEILHILERTLLVLDGLHRAGFVHLFLEPRNVFYLPRREVTLKDPSLRPEFFHSFLELVSSPDFSCLPPEVMDGGFPGPEADVYAVGRLAEKLLERAADRGSSPLAEPLRVFAQTCMEGVEGGGRPGAAVLREKLLAEVDAARSGPFKEVDNDSEEGHRDPCCDAGEEFPSGSGPSVSGKYAGHEEVEGRRARRKRMPLRFTLYRRASIRGRKAITRFALMVMCAFIILGTTLYLIAGDGRGQPSAAFRSGGSDVGGGTTPSGVREVRSISLEEKPEAISGQGFTADSSDLKSDMTGAAAGTAFDATGKGLGVEERGDPDETIQGEQGNALENRPPVAAFTVNPTEGQSPLLVVLDASSSYDPDGRIVSYQWSCGGSGVSIRHVFESNLIPARIAVTLTVTDDAGESARTTRYITLY